MNHIAYHWDFSFLWHYRSLVVWGLGVTVVYTVGSIAAGMVIGLATGLLRLSRNRLLTLPLVAYVEIFRCTPLLVQIIWFYYALPVVLGLDIPATDLVVFYEPIPDVIRTIQRRGRTGRARTGRAVVLVAEGTRDVGLHRSAFARERRMHEMLERVQSEAARGGSPPPPEPKRLQRMLTEFD